MIVFKCLRFCHPAPVTAHEEVLVKAHIQAFLAVTCLLLASFLAAGIMHSNPNQTAPGLSAVCQSHQCACSLAKRCETQCCCRKATKTTTDKHDQKVPVYQNRDCVPFKGFGVGTFRLPSVVFPSVLLADLIPVPSNGHLAPPLPIYWIDEDPLEKIPIMMRPLHIANFSFT